MLSTVRTFAAALALLPLLLSSGARAADKEVKPTRQWSGSVQDVALQKEAPAGGVIADKKAFTKVWKAWRQGEVPAVDFKKELIVVQTTRGGRLRSTARLAENGNLRVLGLATRDLRPGFRYEILVLPRAGVKTVNGKGLPGA